MSHPFVAAGHFAAGWREELVGKDRRVATSQGAELIAHRCGLPPGDYPYAVC